MTTPIICGYEYPSPRAAKAVFDSVELDGRNCSVYNTTTPEKDAWFVLGVFETNDEFQRVDWKDGKPISLDGEQRAWLIDRRNQGKLLHAVGAMPATGVAHHEEGVPMPGGRRRPNATEAHAVRIAADTNAWLANNVADGGVCDFCAHLLGDRDIVTYVIDNDIVNEIGLHGPDGQTATIYDVQDPYWAACPDCDPVIAEGDAATLAAHVWQHRDAERIGVPESHLDTPAEVQRLTDLYQQFYDRNPVRHEGAVTGES